MKLESVFQMLKLRNNSYCQYIIKRLATNDALIYHFKNEFFGVLKMSRPVVSRLMNKHEFLFVVQKIAGGSAWLDRVAQLSAIDKPTLKKYETGEREIANTHALFLRQTYLINKAYPALADDINVLMRKPVLDIEKLPIYQTTHEKSELQNQVHILKGTLAKIEKMAGRVRDEL